MNMTWEERFAAIKALDDDACLCMRSPGDWYVSANMEIKDGQILTGAYGNGVSPDQAVLDHWAIYASVKYPRTIVVHAGTDQRREVNWKDFMWVEKRSDQ